MILAGSRAGLGDMSLDREVAASPPLGGENRWLKVVGGHGLDHSRRGAGEGVMRILHPREKRGPGGAMMGCDAAEGGIQVLVSSFCLSI